LRDSRSNVRLKILLVEDDPAIRELTEILLGRDDHEVVAVASGLEALRAIAERPFDVVLLDEEMPGISGVDVTKRIRARETPKGERQIIFSLTGNTTDEDHARLLAAGFDACLNKPFRPEELREAAARFSLGTAAAPREDDEPPVATGTESDLLARFGGDAKLLRSVAQTFLNDYPAKLRKIKQAIARNDAHALASAAHALKGALAIFGAEDAVENARNLQQMGRQGGLVMATEAFRRLDEALARLDAKLGEYALPASRNPSKSGKGKQPARKPRRRTRRGPRRRR